jgi:integrase/recombinase XerD
MRQPLTDPICVEFIADCGWETSTINQAVCVLNRWTRWCVDHDTAVVDATRAHCRDYLAERQDAVAASTAHMDWRVLKAFYAWLARPVRDGGAGERADNPMEGRRGPKIPKRPATKAAKPDEVATLEAHFDQSELGRRDAAMVSLMWRSGLRVGELPPLNLEHYRIVGDDRAILHVPETKTDEPRDVPVHPETQRYLARYLRKRGNAPGPLFRGRLGHTRDVNGRIQTKAIQDVIRRARERSGVTVRPHQLRRGWTGEYLRAGGDVLSMEIIGGWADHRMPRRYLADEATAAAIDRYYDVATSPRRLRSV